MQQSDERPIRSGAISNNTFPKKCDSGMQSGRHYSLRSSFADTWFAAGVFLDRLCHISDSRCLRPGETRSEATPDPVPNLTGATTAEASSNDPPSPLTSLDPVVVTGRQTSLINIAGSASEAVVGQDEISNRPILRPGEVLETVPGMIVTQHAGGGKANQFFLRGYNLDHGTDFSVFIDGAPINLPSHAHGEGYDDLNILIPELIDTVNYNKGIYNALVGDFSSAGSASLQYLDRLPANLAVATIGENGYERFLLAVSHTFGQNDLWNFNGAPRVLPPRLIRAPCLAPSSGFIMTDRLLLRRTFASSTAFSDIVLGAKTTGSASP